jgi:acyl-CoA thioesterase FadM
MSLEHIDLTLPRHAFSVRDAMRAGDVWRTFQDAAVIGSSRRGWPPQRYTAERCAFVVRQQVVLHHRELQFGESVRAETWVERFRRGIFSTRQTRLFVGDERVGATTQDWVHVSHHDGAMRACRASDSLLSSFEELEREPVCVLPELAEEQSGRPFDFAFAAWHTWMDPLDHANHPAYVDWCDEAIARRVAAAGARPVDVVPIAERVRFKAGVVGGEQVSVRGALVGRTAAGDAVVDFTVHVDDELKADARLVRRMVTGAGPLLAALE